MAIASRRGHSGLGGQCDLLLAMVLPHARADEVTPVLFQRQNLYPVAQGGQVVGVVSKGRLLWAIANGHGNRLITELMNQSGGEGPQFALATVKKR